MLKLPDLELFKRQPRVPHVAETIVRNEVRNRYGVGIVYTVRRSRSGHDWWIYATCNGMRMSNTLHTTVEAKAKTWIAAVESGAITVCR